MGLVLSILVMVLYVDARKFNTRVLHRLVADWRNIVLPAAVVMQLLTILLSTVGQLAPHHRAIMYGRGTMLGLYGAAMLLIQ